jgi:ABC-type amino acid transport substrate-binding protein
MPSRLGYLIVGIGVVVRLSHPAAAAEPLSFGVLAAPPYGLDGADKTVSGSIHDIAELIAAKTGLTFNYRLEPLARLMNDLKVGKLDLLILIPGDDVKQQYALGEIMPSNTVILPKAGVTIAKYEDLKGKTFAILRGAVYDQRFGSDDDIKKYEVDSYDIGLRMTKGGRVDGMIGPDLGLYYQVMLNGMKRDEFGTPLVLNTRTLSLLGSKSIPPELAATLKAAVEELRRSGALSAAVDKYMN